MGRALLRALVGIMPFTQAQAPGIIALSKKKKKKPTGQHRVRDMLTKTRTSGGDGGEAQSASAPGPDHRPAPFQLPAPINYRPLLPRSVRINRNKRGRSDNKGSEAPRATRLSETCSQTRLLEHPLIFFFLTK